MTDSCGQTISVRGVPHYYEWICQGASQSYKPTMVFIHGWGGSARYWNRIARSLSQHFNCLLYDLRGFGRSSCRTESSQQISSSLGYELEEYARDLASLLELLQLNGVYLNAHSMGASVAALFLNRYPDKVSKAILNCNGIFEYDEKAFAAFHKFGGYVVKFRYRWFLKVPLADKLFMARFLYRSISRDLSRDFLEDFIAADYQAALGTIFTSVSKEAVELMPQEFAKIQTPTLLIAGEKDRIIPAEMGRQAAKLNPAIQYTEIAKTSHFPMLEDVPAYLDKIGKFLELEIA